MPFIDATVIDDAIGAAARNKITGGDLARLNRLIAKADVRAQQDLRFAGYSLDPDSVTVANTPVIVQQCSIGYFLKMGLPGVGSPVSEHYEVYTKVGEGIRSGEIRPDGIDPNPRDAVGGVSFTESDNSVSTSIPSVFGRRSMDSW